MSLLTRVTHPQTVDSFGTPLCKAFHVQDNYDVKLPITPTESLVISGANVEIGEKNNQSLRVASFL